MNGFDAARSDRLADILARHVDRGDVGGLVWLIACGDDVRVGVGGSLTRGEPAPVARDSIFRIASMTKPIVAVAALSLVEECRIRMDDPVDDWLPELADRRVLVDGAGPTDGPTVPAERSITLRDVLTFRLGWGMDFERPWPQPLLERLGELELGAGPPEPQVPPEPDEWMRRLGTLPLLYQPGQRWLYNVGSDVLGVLVARVAGQPLEAVLRDRVFEPLGMVDTAFHVGADERHRLGTTYILDPEGGARSVYDAPDGQWASPPAFPSGAAGLVSTVDDLHAFARMLLRRGLSADGERVLSPAAVEAMTTDQLGVLQGAAGPVSPSGLQGWGFGVGVGVTGTEIGRRAGGYGWDGGLGSSWNNDPSRDLAGIVLTTDAFSSPLGSAVVHDFWTATYAALA
jgi:CubicO group peptidase (beta-lactamase class C family)